MSAIEVRDNQGRFVAGHPGTSPGRPRREQERMILDAIANALSAEEIENAIRVALQLAIQQKSTRGIVSVLELCAAYAIGRPTVRVETNDRSKIEDDLMRFVEIQEQAKLRMKPE